MILQVSAGSSWLVRGAAELVLILHISAAGIGLLSGAAALLFRKGGRLHRMAGNVFFVSMLLMSAIGACVAPFLPQPQWGSVIAGVFTFYLVATSWVTVRRNEGSVGHFEIGAFLVALSVAVAGVTGGLQAANSPTDLFAGVPPPPFFAFAAVAALAAALDLRMILRGRVWSTAHRATSLADGRRAAHHSSIVLPRATASLSRVRAWICISFCARNCGLGIDEFLGSSRSIHKLVQG
jgi:hypothetical protein